MSTAAATRLAQPHPGFAFRWRALRDLRILLPFLLLVAVWWALKASGDFPDSILVSPPQAWRAFVHLTAHGVLPEFASPSLTIVGCAALISWLLSRPTGVA